MKCREMESSWEDWVGGPVVRELEEHLRECPRCRELGAALRRTSAWLALLPQEPPEPGAPFWRRLEQRLEESQPAADFWAALGWAGSRLAFGLAALLLLLAVWVVGERGPTQVAEFDAPQLYLDEASTEVPVSNGQLSRDQVMLTLVAQTESPQ